MDKILTMQEVEETLQFWKNPELQAEIDACKDFKGKPKQADLKKYIETQEIREMELISGSGKNYDKFLGYLQQEDEGLVRKAYNFATCSKTYNLYHCKDNNYKLSNHCKDRFCPICRKSRSVKHNKALRAFFKKAGKQLQPYIRFTTLTYENVWDLKTFDFSKISKDMIKFRRILSSFGYRIFGGYRVTEFTHSLETGYNVHIHLLYFADLTKTKEGVKNFYRWASKYKVVDERGKPAKFTPTFTMRGTHYGFISKKILNQIWSYSNHRNSYVTDIEILKYGVGAGVNYICKYMLKPQKYLDGDILFSIYMETRRFRLIQRFGELFTKSSFSVIKLSKVVLVNIATFEKLKYGYDIDNPFLDKKYVDYLEAGIT